LRVRDIAEVTQGPKIRLARSARQFIDPMASSLMTNDVVEGIVFLRKGADTATNSSTPFTRTVQRLNDIFYRAA